jgi:MoaA/NifB/PqqE/SkfB family radical SAM enzyme
MKNNNYFNQALLSAFDYKVGRKVISKKLENRLYENIVKNGEQELKAVKTKKFEWADSLLQRAIINMDKGYIAKEVLNRLTDVFIDGAFHSNREQYREQVTAFEKENGVKPPSFLVISPTQRCNLKCTGCYASSDSNTSPHLDYSVFQNIIREFREKAVGRFIVISGGEPLMYKDSGKTLTDIFEAFSDVFFMFYTNGTLIDKKMAAKLRELGNAIPAISIEGYEKETDARRGKGVHKKILKATENLKNEGVPFIFSITATSQNTELLLSDEFYEYYFDEVGAIFMWQFQLMPIGRGKKNFDLMPSPEQRLKLFRKWEDILHRKKYPLADFWNSGMLTHGCIAYGRNGGYFHIDWNGNIMPCVFVPYTIANINTMYAEGKSLFDALKLPMMKNGREWQYETQMKDRMHPENLLMPCSIRDHYSNFRKHILTPDAKGEDAVADEILNDQVYYQNMIEYDENLSRLTQKIWESEYLK